MQPTPEIEAFVARIVALPPGPGVSLDTVLQPAIDDESELRKLFATDKGNKRLANPHVGLVDVFAAPDAIRTTRARVVDGNDGNAHYVMPIPADDRRKDGSPAMVVDLEEFRKNWAIFTEGSLSQLLDWNNVVAAGGSVLACLTPLDEEHKISKRAIRKYYHSKAYPTSDVDLFLWGLTPEQAEAKIKVIYEAVRDSVPWDVTCIRTKHTVSIHSQYPYRSVQIVLRLYQSPAEILAGFDIDAPCCAYDGQRVWANPRAVVAMMRQCNTVDMTRRSPSYEIRLAKYSRRGYEVYVPDLRRPDVDPTIYERSIARMEGLARLLVLEKLANDGMRTAFLQGRRLLRGRPQMVSKYRRMKRQYKGDLKQETGVGIEMNDYDVASLHIPYGPGWDARRIDKLVYQTDLGMNSTFNPKNKGRRLHRHPAFFGTIEECLEDCCEHCPEPIDEDEERLKKEEDENYISGRIKFIEENPGRQSITGSFNPIDVGEWSGQVYIKPTQQLFSAIALRDRATVQRLLKENIDVNQRDYVGRTTLHVAIAAKATAIVGDLIDAGARITARLADGRAPLHLAAQYDEPEIIKKLLQRNEQNLAEQADKATDDDAEMKATEDDRVRPSSEDDWSSHEDEDVVISGPEDEAEDEAEEEDDESDDDDENDEESAGKKKRKSDSKGKEEDAVPENLDEVIAGEKDQPDIIEINALDWDLGFSALAYAIIYASLPTINALIDAGADPKVPTKKSFDSDPLHPLTLVLVRPDEDVACVIAERLLQLPGVTSSTADENMLTIFHRAVAVGRSKLVETFLRCDPGASALLNFPAFQYQDAIFPIVTSIKNNNHAVLGILLAYGAKLELTEEDVTPAFTALSPEKRTQVTAYGAYKNHLQFVQQPVEIALASGNDIVNLLVAMGATIDVGLKQSLHSYAAATDRRSLIDWLDFALNVHTATLTTKVSEIELRAKQETDEQMEEVSSPWKAHLTKHLKALNTKYQGKPKAQTLHQEEMEIERLKDTKEYLVEIRDTLASRNAKTWNKLYPDDESQAKAWTPLQSGPHLFVRHTGKKSQNEAESGYTYLSKHSYNRQYVPEHLVPRYDELYEACYTGDNDKVQRLCLPVEGQDTTLLQGATPLNISVRYVDPTINSWDRCGYTPLFAAVQGRRWSTARLILAIAVAQYSNEEDDNIKFNTSVDLDDESDDDSDAYDSDASEITIERKEPKFIDIATRPSAIKSDMHPKTMLQDVPAYWAKAKSDGSDGAQFGQNILLEQSIINGDLEAFVQICKLYDALPEPLAIPMETTSAVILKADHPGILDEYIRRTGDGIDIDGASKSEDKEDEAAVPVVMNDANRTYLGLNVHGKKRKDLASKNDPNAVTEHRTIHPLVWRAASMNAKNVVEYLASNRPFEAYKFYASTHSDPRAIWFKRLLAEKKKGSGTVLEKSLPSWLGWHINSLGESPLTAAILSGDLAMIQLLVRLRPSLMEEGLHKKVKFVGANAFNLAIAAMCDTKVIDYLLSKKVSPEERLTRQGWNVFHHLCSRRNADLLEHLLRKLPKDICDTLLTQQSRVRLNTPLHMAVANGAIRCVELLLEYSHSTLLTLNVDGQTPLHKAVEKSWARITELLLAAAPPEAIYIEDCVGQTPLEVADLRAGAESMQNFRRVSQMTTTQALQPTQSRLNGYVLDVCLGSSAGIAAMMAALGESQGKYRTKVLDSCAKWAAQRKGRWEELAARKALRDTAEAEYKVKWEAPADEAAARNRSDTQDIARTLAVIRDAAAAASAMGTMPPRRLIHLFEVQQSVAASLANAQGGNGDHDEYYMRRRSRHRVSDKGQLDEEDSEEKKEKAGSMVIPMLPQEVDAN